MNLSEGTRQDNIIGIPFLASIDWPTRTCPLTRWHLTEDDHGSFHHDLGLPVTLSFIKAN
jgi:hypothetical protein